MSCIAISDNYLAISKGLHIDCYSDSNHTFFNVSSKSKAEENDCIADITISSNSKCLASITSASKQLTVCSLPLTSNKIKTFIVPRSSSKIRFTANNTQILLADKSGDVLLYDLNAEESGTKLLGHLSLLLDVLQTNDGKYIVSCDRDEKIRVSHFPNTYNIETYCLGHTEFVNHIDILPHNQNYLTSSSGDGTVKCWDYVSGTLVHSINAYLDVEEPGLKENFTKVMEEEEVEVTTLPIVHCSVTSFNEKCSLLAVAIHSYNKILIYSLESKDEQFSHKQVEQLHIEKFPTAIKFHKSFLYLYDDVETTVTVFKIINKEGNIHFEFDQKIKMFGAQDVNCEAKSSLETIKVLYKRKFDNVQEYQLRKKKRLEKTLQ